MRQFFIMTICLAIAAFDAKAQDSVQQSNCMADTLYRYICNCGCHNHPVNNYSGLNSLRERLANKTWDGRSERSSTIGISLNGTVSDSDSTMTKTASGDGHGNSSHYDNGSGDKMMGNASSLSCEYCCKMDKGEVPIGVPLYLFFKIATTDLTDEAQQINLNAIADLAKQWHLVIKVTGAADSATGTQDGNVVLSKARADYVVKLLKTKGVPDEQIIQVAEGGISTFTPVSANRHCKVELYKIK